MTILALHWTKPREASVYVSFVRSVGFYLRIIQGHTRRGRGGPSLPSSSFLSVPCCLDYYPVNYDCIKLFKWKPQFWTTLCNIGRQTPSYNVPSRHTCGYPVCHCVYRPTPTLRLFCLLALKKKLIWLRIPCLSKTLLVIMKGLRAFPFFLVHTERIVLLPWSLCHWYWLSPWSALWESFISQGKNLTELGSCKSKNTGNDSLYLEKKLQI